MGLRFHAGKKIPPSRKDGSERASEQLEEEEHTAGKQREDEQVDCQTPRKLLILGDKMNCILGFVSFFVSSPSWAVWHKAAGLVPSVEPL